MKGATEQRVVPDESMLAATRHWLAPVRSALEDRFLAGYLTGSVLLADFDLRRSHVNILVLSRALDRPALETLPRAVPQSRKRPFFEPLFLTRSQVERSLDVFPIEWLDILERHLLIEGEDVLAGLEVPRAHLRTQLEQELRGKHLQLRQAWIASRLEPAPLKHALTRAASGFNALFRTLLRLAGEPVPASTERVLERVADLHGLDMRALLGAHLLRYRAEPHADVVGSYRAFLFEIERLIAVVDEMKFR